MARKHERIDTKAIHAGEPEPRIGNAVVAPIFQSSTFVFDQEGAAYDEIRYVRLNNTPNHELLHAKLAALENAEAALVLGSGMAAITTSLLTFLGAGDHLLVQDCLYGGTHSFVFHDLPALGIEVDVFDPCDPDGLEAKIRPETRVVYAETLTNPLLQVGELEAIARVAEAHGAVSMIDNTFASPFNFRPAEWGFRLSLHSATKYLNGHSDIAAGAVIGEAAAVDGVRLKANHLGGMLDPHACFLLNRGIKTLAVRMRQHNESAHRVATFLSTHQAVTRVNYPGLEDSTEHQRACRFLDGFSGMLSFEVEGGVEAAEAMMRRLEIPLVAPSLGGVETLVTRPATTSHSGMTPAERAEAGVSDSLVRLSIGLEAADDLISDLSQALDSIGDN